MEKIYNKALDERNKDREKRYQEVQQKLDELKKLKERNEISAEEFDDLFSKEIRNYVKEVDKLIQKISGCAWDFSEEKSKSTFAFDDTLLLKPLTEEYYDLYIKTRAEYAYNSAFYLKPKNRSVALCELKQEQSLFMAVVRQADDAYMGYVGLKDTSTNLWEFCIELLPEYCNKGYGCNAVKLFLKKVSEITENDKQQFMALVEVDNIPSQKLMLKLGGRLIDIYDLIFHDEERAEKFNEEYLDEITDHMIELAEELMVEPRKLLSHVLDYRIFAEKL